MPVVQGGESTSVFKNGAKPMKIDSSELVPDDDKVAKDPLTNPCTTPTKTSTVFQFPTVVNGQMTFAGVPVRPIAAALGQPIPADQVSSVASQLTSHMSNVASPMNLMSPKSLATLNTS